MAQPTPYSPSTDFIPFTNIGYVPGQQLDIEFNNLKTTTDQIRANLALIQRDDLLLANGSVDYAQLSPALAAALRAAGVALPGTVVARTQRFTSSTPIVVSPADQIITCAIATAAACTLPSAASRVGVPLTFKDLGQAATNHITLTRTGGDLIDGATTYIIANAYGYVTLVPFTDGTHTGWMTL